MRMARMTSIRILLVFGLVLLSAGMVSAQQTFNTPIYLTKGSTKKDDKFRPFIKHLYLDYAGLLPNSSLKIGMTPTLTFESAEARWGYRSVAKTLVDGYKAITGGGTA